MTFYSWTIWNKIENFQRNVRVTLNNVKKEFIKIAFSLEIKSKWLNVALIKSQKLTIKNQFEQLHVNVNNTIIHLYNLNFFLRKIKTLIKKIMITIIDDWNIVEMRILSCDSLNFSSLFIVYNLFFNYNYHQKNCCCHIFNKYQIFHPASHFAQKKNKEIIERNLIKNE